MTFTSVVTITPEPTSVPTPTSLALGMVRPDVMPEIMSTMIANPMNWDDIVTSDFPGPPGQLVGADSTIIVTNTTTNGTTEMDVFSNPAASFQKRSLLESLALPKRQAAERPAVVDWRNRDGINYLATVQNQRTCGSCTLFAVTALVETMVRIQHGFWSKRSESDLRDSWGKSCSTGAWDFDATDWARRHGGIADAACLPYAPQDTNYLPCADWAGRTVRLPAATPLDTIEKQKDWLHKVGPITGGFQVYSDFYDYGWNWNAADPIYKWNGTAGLDGGHAILVVGYDDVRECWILRNSWSSDWGDKGYFYLSYNDSTVRIDNEYPRLGYTLINPDGFSRRRHQNGLFIHTDGEDVNHHNFLLYRTSNLANGIMEVRRLGGFPVGGIPNYDWIFSNTFLLDETERSPLPDVLFDPKDPKASSFASGLGVKGQPSVIETSFNRNYELIYWELGNRLRHWYYSQPLGQWFSAGHYSIVQGRIDGYPGFTQLSNSGFAITARLSDGSLRAWNRDPVNADVLYNECTISPPGTILQSGPSLVEANIGFKGHLYTVAVRTDGRMQLFWLDSDFGNGVWQAGEIFGSNIANTPPVMIQSYFHTEDETSFGSFQLCVVNNNGQVEHWQRINSDILKNPPKEGEQGQWGLIDTIYPTGVKHVWGLLHGSFNAHLEMVYEDIHGEMLHWQLVGSPTGNKWEVTSLIPGER
jgi:hypothetical protein